MEITGQTHLNLLQEQDIADDLGGRTSDDMLNNTLFRGAMDGYVNLGTFLYSAGPSRGADQAAQTAGHPAIQQALRNAYFDSIGLSRLAASGNA